MSTSNSKSTVVDGTTVHVKTESDSGGTRYFAELAWQENHHPKHKEMQIDNGDFSKHEAVQTFIKHLNEGAKLTTSEATTVRTWIDVLKNNSASLGA